MKIRTGFVSNSSSASFIIKKKFLTEEQIKLIFNHREHSEKVLGWTPETHSTNCDWNIKETEETIEGWTSMNNYNMMEFLLAIGFEPNILYFDGEY